MTVIITILVIALLGYSFVPSVRTSFNNYFFVMEKVDEDTSYKNRKMVEDTARALITNYEAAKSEYELYKKYLDTDDTARAQRAMDAATSANNTVAKYNNYLTENSFVFKGNLPADIPFKLVKVGD